MSKVPLPSIFLAALSGCNNPIPALECDANTVSGTISTGPTDEVVRSDTFTVTGTAISDGIAIRSITVGNVAAKADSANFATWSVAVPIGTLLSLASTVDDADGDGTVPVELTAVATDACGDTHDVGAPFTVSVDTSPDTRVTSLALSVSLPSSGASFIPVDGSSVALITLTANPESANATVQLSASRGTLMPGASVVLAGDGVQSATSSFLLVGDSADDAGTALLTATVEEYLASATVNMAGAPSLYPGSGSLSEGADQVVTVASDGDIDSCWALAADTSAISVTSGDSSLFDGPVTDGDGDRNIEIHVKQTGPADEGATVRVVCCDRYNQCSDDGDDSAGVYTYSPTTGA